MLLQKTQGQFPAPNGGSQLTVTLVSEDPTLFSSLQAPGMHVVHRPTFGQDIHRYQIFFLKKIKNKLKKVGHGGPHWEVEGEGKGRKGQEGGRTHEKALLLSDACSLTSTPQIHIKDDGSPNPGFMRRTASHFSSALSLTMTKDKTSVFTSSRDTLTHSLSCHCRVDDTVCSQLHKMQI